MAGNQLVSIVVPVYRVEAYLDRCMESLLTQTHRNLEIILVDDGSPDRSGEICDEYAARDNRVTVIHQANAGAGPARNAGVDQARGDYLIFVDPDDWIHEELVEHLLSLAVESGAQIAICDFLRTFDDNVAPDSAAEEATILNTEEALRLYAGPTTLQMSGSWAKLYAAHVFAGIRFPKGVSEDVATIHKLVAAADRVVISKRRLYYYFMRPGSATHSEQRVDQLLERAAALQEQAAFFDARGLTEVSAHSAKRAFLILRQVRSRVAASGDRRLLRKLDQRIKEASGVLQRSQQPFHIKAFARAYSIWPQPLDASIWVYRKATGRHRSRSTQLPPSVNPHQESTSSPGLEVIVVAYGSRDMLRTALDAVRGLPVTVVDNSSLPAIADLCASLGCRYIDPGRNGGFGAGVNIGLAHRRVPGSDVLLLNPDAAIDVESVQALQAGLRAYPDVASVGPRQVDAFGKPIRVAWPFPSPGGTWLETLGLSRLRTTKGYVSGAILLLRSEALDELGPFDERFFLYAEEADWQYRAVKAGWRNLVLDSVTAMHIGGGTSSDEARRITHFYASHERFLRKHYGALGWQLARVGQLIGDAVRSLIRTGPTRARLIARARLYLSGPVRIEDQIMSDRSAP